MATVIEIAIVDVFALCMSMIENFSEKLGL
jgi:hypothetical protein